MDFLFEKIAYIKGLAEGLDIKDDTKEGKLFMALIDIIEEMAESMEEIVEEQDDVNEYLDLLDEDLSVIEEEIFGDLDEFDDEDDFDFDDEDDFEFDEDDEHCHCGCEHEEDCHDQED